MKKQELKDLSYLYCIVILGYWIFSMYIAHTKEVTKLNRDLIEAKTLVIALDKDYSNALDMVNSMNSHSDYLELELQSYKYLEQFKKELDRRTSK